MYHIKKHPIHPKILNHLINHLKLQIIYNLENISRYFHIFKSIQSEHSALEFDKGLLRYKWCCRSDSARFNFKQLLNRVFQEAKTNYS